MNKARNPAWIAGSIVGMLLVVMVLVFVFTRGSSNSTRDDKQDTGGQSAGTAADTVYMAPRFRTMRVFDSIPPEGIRLYLRQGWQDFPLGGAITIQMINESGSPVGPILHDEPGVQHDFGFQPDGLYIIHADPQGSRRGVRLYNQW